MKIKNKKTYFLLFSLVFLGLFAGILTIDAANTYTPMEEIPGFGKPTTFPAYVLAVYKFGLWTIGIVAVLMISVGGYMYLTSAGNNASVEKAKSIITDAILGFILAMVSYLILYIINPDLVSLNPLTQRVGGIGAAGSPGSVSGPTGTTKGYQAACPDTSSTTAIDYSKAKNDSNIKLSSACDKYDFSNSFNVNKCVLKAMAQMESNCGTNTGPSSAGACGLMQLLPATATQLNNNYRIDSTKQSITCDDLKNSNELSIKLAAAYIKQNSAKPCVNAAKDKNSAIFAGYNSGYGCSGTSCSPKHALCSSSDCSDALAFECCKNPGGLDESINYAWNGVGLLSQCSE